MRFIRLCAGVAAMLAMTTACQSPGPESKTSPTTSTGGSTDLTAIGRQYSQCIRDHGVPDFPDMVVLGGHLTLPDDPAGDAGDRALRANPAAREACKSILDKAPAAARKGDGSMSAQDREKLLKYANCMRQNGIPEWPDPSADGSFALAGTPLEAEGKSARVATAMQACKQHWDKGISVK